MVHGATKSMLGHLIGRAQAHAERFGVLQRDGAVATLVQAAASGDPRPPRVPAAVADQIGAHGQAVVIGGRRAGMIMLPYDDVRMFGYFIGEEAWGPGALSLAERFSPSRPCR